MARPMMRRTLTDPLPCRFSCLQLSCRHRPRHATHEPHCRIRHHQRFAERSATSDTVDYARNSVAKHSCWVEPHVANNASIDGGEHSTAGGNASVFGGCRVPTSVEVPMTLAPTEWGLSSATPTSARKRDGSGRHSGRTDEGSGRQVASPRHRVLRVLRMTRSSGISPRVEAIPSGRLCAPATCVALSTC